MSLLIAGLIVFIGSHSAGIVAHAWRERVRARHRLWWHATSSVASVLGLVLIWQGYARARLDPVLVYSPMPLLRSVALVLLLAVFPLIFASFLPGRIRARLEFPAIVGVKVWAVAHLLANGTLADVVLFGSIFAWAVAEQISIARHGAPTVPAFPESRFNDVVAIMLGTALYALMVGAGHQWLTGMPIGVPF